MSNPDPALAGYWPGPWPAEDAGPRRTQVPPDPQAGIGLQPGEKLVARSRGAIMGCMTVLRDPGEVYLHGQSGPGTDTTAWVQRIHPHSLDALKRSPDLPGGPFWPGGIAAHANGDLYVTYGRHCHRLDPDCQPIASRELPRVRPYNSLLILPDGNLIMKDFAGGAGVNRLPEGMRGSELVVLEPERLEIIARHELPQGSIARLSADVLDDGTPLVYVIGDRHAMRLRWDAAALTLDDTWMPEYLRFDGQTFGWDVVLEAGSAWFLDNGEGTNAFGPSFMGKGTSPSPLHLIRIPLDGPPYPEYLEVCGRPGGIIANPPAVDAERRIAVGYDSGNGVITAWHFGEPGQAEPLWTRDQDQAGHMILFRRSGELMCYDYDHSRGSEQVVLLDIETGAEKGCVAIDSPLQCVVFPAAGPHRDLYATTFTTIAHITVE